ncbi:MAG: hypothetical protein WHX52_01320 [Anaerolineae bacterium]
MNTQPAFHKVQLTLPATLYNWLSEAAQQRAQAIPEVIQTAIEYYQEHFDLFQTQTWKLCGAFTVAESAIPYQEEDNAITNYAEHIDEVLYGAPQ